MKIILFANTDWYLAHYRLSLARAISESGHEVVFLSPPGKYHSTLMQAGFRWISTRLDSKGMNPFTEIAAISHLTRLYRREAVDIVHHFTIKCVIYGSLAARLAGVKRVVNSITGLGYVFSERGLKAKLVRFFVKLLYRISLPGTKVIFQNPDDRMVFLKNRLASEQNTFIIRGSGVDLTAFHYMPEPEGIPVVLLAARMLWHKGIGDFVAAAQKIKADKVPARFVLVGDSDPSNPVTISKEQLMEWDASGVVEWWGWREDMAEVYAHSNIVCLPSYYGEGVPRSLIEACACGRPIVTTDMPGCREVVVHGENGFLVSPKDSIGLASALLRLIQDPKLRQQMGAHSRQLAETVFSEQIVLDKTLCIYHDLAAQAG